MFRTMIAAAAVLTLAIGVAPPQAKADDRDIAAGAIIGAIVGGSIAAISNSRHRGGGAAYYEPRPRVVYVQPRPRYHRRAPTRVYVYDRGHGRGYGRGHAYARGRGHHVERGHGRRWR